jgi:O-antigen/teichoic acid export membrane protein
VLLFTWHYSGFEGTSPIVISFCSQAYYLVKYSDLALTNKLVFVMAAISVGCSAISLVIVFSWVIRNCQSSTEWSLCAKRTTIFTVSTSIVVLVVPCAHYLTLLVELGQCTVTKDDTQLIVLALMGVVALVVGVVMWIMLVCREN